MGGIINENTKWALGIVVALIIQTVAITWFFANLNAQVQTNTSQITELRGGAAVYLTRAQLEDILGARDQKLVDIETSVTRVEKKIDTLTNIYAHPTTAK